MSADAPPLHDPPRDLAREAAGSAWRLAGRTLRHNRLATAGLIILVALVLFSWLGPLIHHSEQHNPDLGLSNHRPGAGHLLGVDVNGYDVLGRLMLGGQNALLVAFAVGIGSTVIGLIYGAISGYCAGRVDWVLMRIIDVGLAIPVVFLFIYLAQVFKPTLWLLIALLTGVSWLVPARLVRGESLSLRTREYVEAARGMGARPLGIVVAHLIPNTIGTITVTVTFQAANAILALATLQFLGFGLQPSTPTWGSMLNSGWTYFQVGYWWEFYPPLILIILTVLALNFVGEALQDAFGVTVSR